MHGAVVEPSVRANRSVIIWYIDLVLQSLICAASTSKTSERRTNSIKYRNEFEKNAVDAVDVADVIVSSAQLLCGVSTIM